MNPLDIYPRTDFPGAVVIPNTWWVISSPLFEQLLTLLRAILHDPVTYPEPDGFKPERFLNTDGSLRDDPTLISVFGYGKRICPGRHFVDASLFIFIASLLSVFNMERGKDGGGDKLSDYTFTGGTIIR